MVYKIKQYEVPIYNGYFSLTLPKFSDIVGVIANTAEPGKTPIQVLVEESIAVVGEEVETREAKLLVVADGSPYGEAIKDSESLMYLGHAMWDNGYRINHVFEVVDEEFEYDALVASVVGEPKEDLPTTPQLINDLSESIENLAQAVVELEEEETEVQNVEKASDPEEVEEEIELNELTKGGK